METVSAIIATRNRPEMLAEAITAVMEQSYAGTIEVLVVFDQSVPDHSVERRTASRSVRVLTNTHRPGLAGARNTGIEAAVGTFVAFCDDDDVWLPHKVAAQVALLAQRPNAQFATCDISVQYNNELHLRPLGLDSISFSELLRDRHTELHPSTFFMRRRAVVEGFGMVSEEVPGGFGEDYEFLLRAARSAPIVHVPQPLTMVRWGNQSFFFQRWQTMSDGLSWILAKYPEFEGVPAGSARIRGQLAFANAALGHRGAALRWAVSATQRNPLELRVPLALAMMCGLMTPERIMASLHKRGRGI